MLYETKLVYTFVHRIFPIVDEQLKQWKEIANQIPDPELRKQALASLSDKRFHAQGGTIYALYPGLGLEQRNDLLKFIVAYQTISDYLDNLCDRAGVENAQAFRQLHLAMEEALVHEQEVSDYYQYYPFWNDGGYLRKLVKTCQDSLNSPNLTTLLPIIERWAGYYSELQTNKHISLFERELAMKNWLEPLSAEYPRFYTWEIAAATGSTLGIFFLAALTKSPLNEKSLAQVEEAYFPWVCAIHILLDYFIDRFEDERNGDLNFVQSYKSDLQMTERMTLIYREARLRTKKLANPRFHLLVLDGLLAMYLSDLKADEGMNRQVTKALLSVGGIYTKFLHWVIKKLRRSGVV